MLRSLKLSLRNILRLDFTDIIQVITSHDSKCNQVLSRVRSVYEGHYKHSFRRVSDTHKTHTRKRLEWNAQNRYICQGRPSMMDIDFDI